MAGKAVIDGGKRDEIIYVAMKLFFENGYEATSVRAILDMVGGEVGMFYHYFKSKDALFQTVVERFFLDYKKRFGEIEKNCSTREQFLNVFLDYYSNSMKEFNSISGNMHWTIIYSMTARTIEELKPVIVNLLTKWGYSRNELIDIVAGQFLYGISATLHSQSFQTMAKGEQKEILAELAERLLR